MGFPLTEAELRSLFDAINDKEIASLKKQLAEARGHYHGSLSFDIAPELDKR